MEPRTVIKNKTFFPTELAITSYPEFSVDLNQVDYIKKIGPKKITIC